MGQPLPWGLGCQDPFGGGTGGRLGFRYCLWLLTSSRMGVNRGSFGSRPITSLRQRRGQPRRRTFHGADGAVLRGFGPCDGGAEEHRRQSIRRDPNLPGPLLRTPGLQPTLLVRFVPEEIRELAVFSELFATPGRLDVTSLCYLHVLVVSLWR